MFRSRRASVLCIQGCTMVEECFQGLRRMVVDNVCIRAHPRTTVEHDRRTTSRASLNVPVLSCPRSVWNCDITYEDVESGDLALCFDAAGRENIVDL